jgi:NADPH-dependent curcumin reductase CurA
MHAAAIRGGTMATTRRWVLRRFVENGRAPLVEDFELQSVELPTPGPGELLVRVVYLSMDPYMRGRISPAKNYTEGVRPGGVMTGRGVVLVLESRAEGWAAGDIAMGETGWQEACVVRAADLRRVDPRLAPISTAVGLLGMPGLSAYFALLDLGEPRAGDTVLVTAASGAVGSAAGQIARIAGCRTIAVVGSASKVRYCTEELGYDAAIDYRIEPDLAAAVKAAAPRGVDVFFDNSGGSVHRAVLPSLAVHARVVICGVMSQYNPIEASRPTDYDFRQLLVPRARVSGFLIYDFAHRTREGLERLSRWYRDGLLKYRETVAQGIEKAPEAFSSMLAGENLGKQLVQVSPDPTRG